ncbi:hypothetical protein MHC_02075 [Mycoplasma haemocanis str. Illinois]|uniref:Uncharacterized protein n=1 Tax=Mycoplasma haemocanis (strain Illinois) TaxID=1111676 RepID=H6N6K9_MYCHN|nr:hypothetical protein [Mycoplasma haemocanis]AEW45281.1 hypothetical protein MHC_02075 [Mycoplasma haemocanis str. Illinois]
MSGTVAKCLALAGGVGGVCGGGVLLAKNINSQPKRSLINVKDRLLSEGYKLLNLNDPNAEGWDKVKSAYASEANDEKRFPGVERNVDYSVIGIHSNCLDLIEKEEATEEDYLKARRWCVIPITVSSKFASGALLKYDEGDSTDDTLWNKLANKHWGAGVDAKSKISNENKSTEEEKRKEIKQKCKALAESDSTSENFYETINKVDMWCSKASANSIS